MKTADSLRKLIDNSIVETSVQTDQRILKDALERLEKVRQDRLAGARPNVWRLIMKSPITKLATAAIVAIACLIGLSLWRGTESGIALADVLARIEKVKAFRCQWSEKATGEDPNKPYSSESRGTILISQDGWKSNDEELDPNGGKSAFEEWYRLPDKKTIINIVHKQKKYWRTEWDDRWAEEWQKSDPRTFLKQFMACKHKSLGRSTVDGIEVEGFRTTDPNCLGYSKDKLEGDVKVWADVKTRLPVRYDFTTACFDQRGDKIIERGHFVMHNFEWDVPVDAAEFEPPPIPDGYTSLVVKLPAHITEEIAVQGLKLCVEFLGNYPDPESFVNFFTSIRSALEKSDTAAALRLKEELKGLTEQEKVNRLSDATLPIRCLVRFYLALQWDKKDPAHYGRTVTPKDADKVLMRWKLSDNEYRVIYGDLHAETVTPEKLAELEKLLPK